MQHFQGPALNDVTNILTSLQAHHIVTVVTDS
jgi:hypothetical protein